LADSVGQTGVVVLEGQLANADDLMLQDLFERYRTDLPEAAFSRLYPDGTACDQMFAILHQRLNALFDFLNEKAEVNGHFNADPSRELLDLIKEITEARQTLDHVGDGMEVHERYLTALEKCTEFLSRSGGSAIPDGFEVELIKFEPAFFRNDAKVRIKDRSEAYDLIMVGSGSYAHVYRYDDPVYQRTFAVKRAKRDISEQDLVRLNQEFEILKGLNSPYIVEVHTYDEDKHQYTMEFCDSTLRDFIDRENSNLRFGARKRMALQFLFGMNYLHGKGHLHRDVSYQNVLVKQYDPPAVVLKLSDFGFLKKKGSELTRTESELRGTLLDPALESFKDYDLPNEIYCIGRVLSFIFSGRTRIDACAGKGGDIVRRCVDVDTSSRFPATLDIIRAVENCEP